MFFLRMGIIVMRQTAILKEGKPRHLHHTATREMAPTRRADLAVAHTSDQKLVANSFMSSVNNAHYSFMVYKNSLIIAGPSTRPFLADLCNPCQSPKTKIFHHWKVEKKLGQFNPLLAELITYIDQVCSPTPTRD